MKTQIIAIGGGAFSFINDTYPIEEYILQQTDKPKPNVCYIGTATGDATHHIVRFYDIFQNFSCHPSHLSLYAAPKDIESHILKQDIIFVGGGNTKNLLTLWRAWDLDKMLHKAMQNGTILTGSSAGSICWYEEGLSDYIFSEFNALPALGFLKGSNCPHFDSEAGRRPRYHELVGNGTMKEGIAADDHVALHYVDGKLQHIVSAKPQSKAYQMKRSENGVEEIVLQPDILL